MEVIRMAIPWRKLRIPGIALLLIIVVVATVLLIPRKPGETLARCQELYDRGEYSACSRILTKQAAKNPDWHEGRNLLVEAQLADNDPLGALPHYLYLLEAGEAGRVKTKLLKQLAETEEYKQRARELLTEMLDAKPELNKTREFAAEFELHVNNLPGALLHLHLLSAGGKSSRNLEGKAARSCSDYSQWEKYLDELLAKDPQLPWSQEMKLTYAWEHDDIELVGKILDEIEDLGLLSMDITEKIYDFAFNRSLTVAMDVAINTNHEPWIEQVIATVEQSEPDKIRNQLPGLLNLLPDDSRLQILSAFYLLPAEKGLQFLLTLENQGFTPRDTEKYVHEKVRLLQQAHIFDFKYLKFLGDTYVQPLVELALECRHTNPQGLLDLASYLEASELCAGESDVRMLRSFASFSKPAPKIIWQREGTQPDSLSMSPEGKWLACTYPSETIVVNLGSGKVTSFSLAANQWYWNPDGNLAAATSSKSNTLLLLLDVSEGKIQGPRELTIPKGAQILGWMDNSQLALVSTKTDGEGLTRAGKLDISIGKVQWLSEYRKGWATLNNAGELVWIEKGNDNMIIDTGKSKKSYPLRYSDDGYKGTTFLEGTTFLDWFPDDKKIMFAENEFESYGVSILDLERGKTTFQYPSWIYSPGSWAGPASIWDVEYLYYPGQFSPLVKFNMETGESEYTGVLLPFSGDVRYCSAGNIVAVACEGDHGVQVYQIP